MRYVHKVVCITGIHFGSRLSAINNKRRGIQQSQPDQHFKKPPELVLELHKLFPISGRRGREDNRATNRVRLVPF